MNYIEEFEETVAHLTNNKTEVTILVAVSGGIDSMCLLDQFRISNQFKFSVAHCNFNLRGEDSIKDEELVQNYCSQYSIRLHVKTFETTKEVALAGTGIQETARNLRYTWFNQLLEENNYTHIALAHHADDQAETILYNLIRGAGVNGLKGMLAVNKTRIRPFLSIRRKQIEEYVKLNQVPYREDRSNAENHYARNQIRNSVIPLLNNINEQAVSHVNTTGKMMVEAHELIKQVADEFSVQYIHHKGDLIFIDRVALIKTNYPTLLLNELIGSLGFNANQQDQIIHGKFISGAKFISTKAILYLHHEEIIVEKNLQLPFQIQCSTPPFAYSNNVFELNIENVAVPSLEKLKSGPELYLDNASINLDHCVIRNWLPGDQFKPLGMETHQKLSDFFINQKISIPQKNRCLILQYQDEIAAVIPLRIAQQFKVNSDSKSVLKITTKYL